MKTCVMRAQYCHNHTHLSTWVSVCLSVGVNLWTGASRCLTNGTIGLSGTFVTKLKGIKLSKTASLECVIN